MSSIRSPWKSRLRYCLSFNYYFMWTLLFCYIAFSYGHLHHMNIAPKKEDILVYEVEW